MGVALGLKEPAVNINEMAVADEISGDPGSAVAVADSDAVQGEAAAPLASEPWVEEDPPGTVGASKAEVEVSGKPETEVEVVEVSGRPEVEVEVVEEVEISGKPETEVEMMNGVVVEDAEVSGKPETEVEMMEEVVEEQEAVKDVEVEEEEKEPSSQEQSAEAVSAGVAADKPDSEVTPQIHPRPV